MLYLASQSPRRRELLGQLGANFSILDVDVEEMPFPEEAPIDYVKRVARDKALAGWQSLTREAQTDALVIASDTEVVPARRVFGKPKDADDAVEMLQALSGRTHEVISAVCVVSGQLEKG